MKKFHVTLSNQGLNEFNDHVLQNETFSLLEDYHLYITPNTGTQFWRFGLIFSTYQDFLYDPANGRYRDRSLKFFEIVAGDWQTGIWKNPNKIELLTNHFSAGRTILEDYSNYIENTPLKLEIHYDDIQQYLIVRCNIGDWHSAQHAINIGNYKYFKIAAWADTIPFQISCEGLILPQTPIRESSLINNLWLIKLNLTDDQVKELNSNSLITLNPLHSIETFFKKGDKALGYVDNENQYIFGEFELLETTNSPEQNQSATIFSVRQKFNPYINRNTFKDKINKTDKLLTNPIYDVISLSEDDYNSIISSAYDIPLIETSINDKKYLEILYQNFLAGIVVEDIYSLQEIWNDLVDFHPSKMNSLLVYGSRQITIFGIAQIHPESPIFGKFEKTIFSIKTILSLGKTDRVSSSQILEKTSNLDLKEIGQVFLLMNQFAELTSGHGKDDKGEIWINTNDTRVLEVYRSFNGLQEFLSSYLEKSGIPIKSNGNHINLVTEDVNSNIQKTVIIRRHQKDFLPVMGVLDLADDLINIIRQLPDEKGQMIGIFGKWGRGKSTLLRELAGNINNDSQRKFLKIDFDAWKYQDTPAIWAYMYEVFASEYLGSKKGIINFISYYRKTIILNAKRDEWLTLFKFILALIVSAAAAFKLNDMFKGYLPIILPSFLMLAAIITKQFKKDLSVKAVDLVNKYTTRHSFKQILGAQADIQDELIKLLKTWISDKKAISKKILFIVDDLDRCSEEKIIQIIDALRVMLDEDSICKRVIVLVAVDERILKNAIKNKYDAFYTSLPKNGNANDDKPSQVNELVGEYLDKLFILAIKLGNLSLPQKHEFFDELIKNDIQIDKQGVTTSDNNNSSKTGAIHEDSTTIEREDTSQNTPSIKSSTDRSEAMPSDKNGDNVTLINKNPVNKSVFAKLNSIEIKLLKQIIDSWKDATPRRMTIFYYRYLLCKNMLINKYNLINKPNVWDKEPNIFGILTLIKKYGEYFETSRIIEERENVIQQKDQEQVVIKGLNFSASIEKSDYLYLLEILELIIAY